MEMYILLIVSLVAINMEVQIVTTLQDIGKDFLERPQEAQEIKAKINK